MSHDQPSIEPENSEGDVSDASSVSLWSVFDKLGVAVVLVVIGIFPAMRAYDALKGPEPTVQQASSPVPADVSMPAYDFPQAAASPKLTLSWQDATLELAPIAARMTTEERAALGLTTLATGVDIYAVRVAVRNSGAVPVYFEPGYLAIHFGQESARVYQFKDASFLTSGTLHPGESKTGLAAYIARADIGASIRSRAGAMSYSDHAVVVTWE